MYRTKIDFSRRDERDEIRLTSDEFELLSVHRRVVLEDEDLAVEADIRRRRDGSRVASIDWTTVLFKRRRTHA